MHKKRFFKKILPIVLVLALLGAIYENRKALAEPGMTVKQDGETPTASPTLIPPPSTMPTPTDSVITSAPTLPPGTFPPITPTGSALPTDPPIIVDQGSCGMDSGYTLDEKGVLRISGKGAVAEQSFRGRSDIRSVEVENTITTIEGAAFMDCRSLTTVTLPSALQSIGDCAFAGCSLLSAVKIPSTVSTIGAQAFLNTGMTAVTIPATVTSVGIQSFANNSKLSSVKLEGASTRIGWGAFTNLAANSVVNVPVNFSDANGLKDAVNGSTRIQYGDSGASPTTVPMITTGPIVPVYPVVTSTPNASAWPTYTPPVQTVSPEPTISPEPTTSPEPSGDQVTPSKPVIKKAVSKKRKQIQIHWKKANNADGYQIRFSTDKNFKKKELTTVPGTKTTLKNLKGKTYYIAVRAYYVGLDGIVYGAWSKKKKVTVKK